MTFRNHFLRAMEPDDRTALKPFMEMVLLSQGERLRTASAPNPVVAFPESAVLTSQILVEGDRLVDGLSTGVETGLGLLDAVQERPEQFAHVARVAGSAIVLPADVFRRRVDGGPGLRSLLLTHVRAQGIFAQHLLVCPSIHRAPSRIARVLLQTADRTDGPFALSQESIAANLLLQRTTVTSCMTALRKAGVIEYSRGRVDLTNRLQLEQEACGCYRAFRDLYGLRFGK